MNNTCPKDPASIPIPFKAATPQNIKAIDVPWARALLVSFLCLAAIFLHGLITYEKVYSGYPYEEWDEIGSSNNAAVLAAPESLRVYSYGSLDTFVHALSHYLYQKFDPVGKRTLRHTYSNNVLESIQNPFLTQGEKTWEGMDYTYWRGLADRKPVFIARGIYFRLVYVTLALVAGVVAFLYPGASIAILSALLFFISTKLFIDQSALALPNATNALIGILILICVERSISTKHQLYLYLASGLFACALNFKIDALLLGPSIALASLFLLLHGLFFSQKSLLTTIGSWSCTLLKCAVIFVTVLVATKPSLLWRPLDEFSLQWHVLHPLVGLKINTAQNFIDLFSYLQSLIALPSGLLSPVTLVPSLLLSAILVMQSANSKNLEQTFFSAQTIATLLVALTSIWLILVPTYTATQHCYLRYFLTGTAGAALSLGLIIYQISHSRYAILRISGSLVMFFVMLFSFASLHNTYISLDSARSARANLAGLDPIHNRSRAMYELLEEIHQGKLSHTVLVDQHAYFDNRFLVERNLDVRYINIFNFKELLQGLKAHAAPDAKPVGIIFVNADGGYSGEPGLRFAEYYKTLNSLPKTFSIEGSIMSTLDPSPPYPKVNVQIAKLE